MFLSWSSSDSCPRRDRVGLQTEKGSQSDRRGGRPLHRQQPGNPALNVHAGGSLHDAHALLQHTMVGAVTHPTPATRTIGSVDPLSLIRCRQINIDRVDLCRDNGSDCHLVGKGCGFDSQTGGLSYMSILLVGWVFFTGCELSWAKSTCPHPAVCKYKFYSLFLILQCY